jgi:hypothetical protein
MGKFTNNNSGILISSIADLNARFLLKRKTQQGNFEGK